MFFPLSGNEEGGLSGTVLAKLRKTDMYLGKVFKGTKINVGRWRRHLKRVFPSGDDTWNGFSQAVTALETGFPT